MASIYDNIEQMEIAVERYPWWCGAQISRIKAQGTTADSHARLVAMLHPLSLVKHQEIDVARLTHLTTDDLIERFLKRDEYRIVAEEGDAEDLATMDCEEDDLVSEDLAELYQKQGLYDEAIATYRKLSLLNSEKSIYFAELIASLEEQKKQQ